MNRIHRPLAGAAIAAPLFFASACYAPDNPEALTTERSCSGSGLLWLSETESLGPPTPLAAINEEISEKALLFQQSQPRRKKRLGAELARLAGRRARLLETQARLAASAVTGAALDEATQAALPPAARARLEKNTEKSGKLEIYGIDGEAGGEVRYFLKEERTGKKHPLHLKESAALRVAHGTRVHVRGILIPTEGLAASASDPENPGMGLLQETGALMSDPIIPEANQGVSPLEAALESAPVMPNTMGPQPTAAIVVGFSDLPAAHSAAEAQDVVFNQASGFLQENSSGQTWLTGQVFGPFRIAASSASCDTGAIATQAKAAARNSGADLSPYTRFVYIFPSNPNCGGWIGLGTIGGRPSESWINGALDLHTVAHELGHNLGLYHANAWSCGSTTLAAPGSACRSLEYQDPSDVMGNILAGHHTAYQKEQLGWLNRGASPPIQMVRESGTFQLEPYESGTLTPKALKILKSRDPVTGARTYYYVEYRQPLGYDQVFSRFYQANNLTSSVLIHTGSDSNINSSYLLNMNPHQSSFSKAGLNVGQTFTDPVNGNSITLNALSPLGATVSVLLAGAPPTSPPPGPGGMTLSIVSSQSGYRRGQVAQVQFDLLDADSNPIQGAPLRVRITDPGGGVTELSTQVGQGGQLQQSYRIEDCSRSGLYQVSAAAQVGADQISGAASFQVQ